MQIWDLEGTINKNTHVPSFPSPPDKCIYHPVFWNVNTLEVKGLKFRCQQFLIASVIHPTCVSPSWWRWWHCSCCLCIASRAWRRHLSGIPARPYPAEDGKADHTLLTAPTGQRREYVSVSLYQRRENITQLFQCVVTERSGWINPPPGLDSVSRKSLMLQYEMKQS